MKAQYARPVKWLRRAVGVGDGEVAALLWSFAYFFCLLTGYYILRPLRDEMGIAGGVANLPWLFTATFIAMLVAVPVFGFIVARFPRRTFVPLVYWFFIANIVVFYGLFTLSDSTPIIARAFFVWVSLFNLFVVSVFWSFMADIFRNEQGRRLFGFIAAGGSAGALLGPSLTAALAVPLGPTNLLPVSAFFLAAAVLCIHRLLAVTGPREEGHEPGARRDEAIGGGVFAGVTEVARSPYLIGICVYMVLYTTTSTFLYFEQAHIVAGAFEDAGERTRLFALIDLAVGLLTLATQCMFTGRMMVRFGVGAMLAFVPALTLVGFLALAVAPGVALIVAFQALRRAANFALSRPAREVLYTVVTPERKYKSKNFIDTVVYRGGDAASGWAFAGLAGLGLELAAIALVAVPLAALWIAVGIALGARQERLADVI
ncbi:MAG: MFS transporter [Rhodospirillales bacterium]|jgi:AAA family ATP:ADP antiporter|nr:MFS transporter [Rhodospirillales bacterium]